MGKKSSSRKSRRIRLLKRFLLAGIALLLVLGIAGAAGFHLLKGWRARDLAGKALQNFEQANYRAAWLQINSARNLRPDDPKVLRSSALLESRFGLASGLDAWNKLAEMGELTKDDLEPRARAAARLGNDMQFEQAVSELEESGDIAGAGKLRSARQLLHGDIDEAIEHLRRLVAENNDPLLKLDLAKLLLQRHMDRLAQGTGELAKRIADELTGIVDSLENTPARESALAFGLSFLLPAREHQSRWAGLAMENMQPDNPALLPAAAAKVRLGEATAADLHMELLAVFNAAPLDRRAAYSLWLTRHNMPAEALTLTTAQESGESTDAFVARTEALAALGNWNAVIELADAGGHAPQSMRLAAKARAEYALGRGAQSGAMSVGDALRSAARTGEIAPAMIVEFDQMGAGAAVDAALVDLCGDPRFGDTAFRMARDRFSRRGPAGADLLAAAHQRVSVVSPQGSSVIAYERYKLLLNDIAEHGLAASAAGRQGPAPVDPQDTAAAVEASPSDVSVRATHALALIQAGRSREAFGVFDDITVYFNRLPPSLQAVLAAAAAASGESQLAGDMRKQINARALSPAEKKLLPDPATR